MRARDLMTADVIILPSTATVGDAIETVSQNDVRHVPILDNGHVVGLISDRDLRRIEGMLAPSVGDSVNSLAVLAAPITTLVWGDPITAGPDASADDLIEIFLGDRVGAIPIVDSSGTLVGIVSVLDVLAAARGKL